MNVPATPAEMRAYIVERLTGDTGEPDRVIEAGRALAQSVAPQIAKRMKTLLGAPMAVEIVDVGLSRLVQARPQSRNGHAAAVVASPLSPDAFVMVLDGGAIASALSLLFGGEAAAAPIERDLSAIEIEVASLLLQEIADAVDATGRDGKLGLALPVQPILAGQDLERLSLRDGPALSILLSLGAGTIRLTAPQRVLLKGTGAGSRKDDTSAAAGEWGARIGEEVMRSAVVLEATMPVARMTLGDLADLRRGQVLEMEAGGQNKAQLSARGKTLFSCEFGKLGQNYTLRVKQPFDATQDLIADLLPG